MAFRPLSKPGPIEAILFDLHSTLVDQGEPSTWLEAAWAHAGRSGTALAGLGEERFGQITGWVHRIWEHAIEVDPRNERDLSPAHHRRVFAALMARLPEVDAELAQSLYAVMLDTWIAYDDALPTLRELKRRGLKLALVSNIGVDLRPLLERARIADLFDAVILSFEAGAVKPDRRIFEQALAALGVAPAHALMVGDSARDDAGAALIGIRTLLLPRTAGAEHGLDLVLRMVGTTA